MNTNQYLDALKNRHNLPSDYKLAQLLGTTRQTISNYRHGRKHFSDQTALQISGLLDIPAAKIMIDMRVERTKDKDVRNAWKEAMEYMGGIAASVMLAVVVMVASPTTAEAAFSASSVTNNTYYAQFAQRLRRRIIVTFRHISQVLRRLSATTRLLQLEVTYAII